MQLSLFQKALYLVCFLLILTAIHIPKTTIVHAEDVLQESGARVFKDPLPFIPLAGIPGLRGNESLDGLVQALYKLAIIAAALFAVLRITYAGFVYMSSDIISSKESARSSISASLLGLLIILSAVLILQTISGTVNLNIFAGAPALEMTSLQPDASVVAAQFATIIPAKGCEQAQSTCPSGTTMVFLPNRLSCYSSSARIPTYPGSVFRPLTKDECSFVGTGDSIIRNGGSLYGTTDTSLGQMTAALQNTAPTQSQKDAIAAQTPDQIRQQYIDAVLTPACNALTTNAPNTLAQKLGSNRRLCDSRGGTTIGGRPASFDCGLGGVNNDTNFRFICSATSPSQ